MDDEGVGDAEMEVAPIDADAISGAMEQGLIAGAEVEESEICCAGAAPGYWLRSVVDGDLRVDVEEEIDVVRLAVCCCCAPREIGDRA